MFQGMFRVYVLDADSGYGQFLAEWFKNETLKVFRKPLPPEEVMEYLLNNTTIPEDVKSKIKQDSTAMTDRLWYRIVAQPSSKCRVPANEPVMLLNPYTSQGEVGIGYISEENPGGVILTFVPADDIKKGEMGNG